MTSTDTNSCVLLCDVCRTPVTGRNGYLQIDEVKAAHRQQAVKGWEDRHRTPGGGVSFNIADKTDPPPARVHWDIYHEACDPDPENQGYSIPADACATYDQLLVWTAHLLEKTWLPDTDWAATIRRILQDSGSTARTG